MKVNVNFYNVKTGKKVDIKSFGELKGDLKMVITNNYGEFIEQMNINEVKGEVLFIPIENNKYLDITKTIEVK